VPKAADGPVPVMLASELTMARSGGLDASLLAKQPFYGTNFTGPLLFMEDGAYFSTKAQAMNLTRAQWGVMNETGSYPASPGCGSTRCGTRSPGSPRQPTWT
jgi:hypothetical protein